MDDEALTEAEGNPGRDRVYSNWRDGSSFATINRPATRGELARHWLADMLPESLAGDPWFRKSRGELMENARAFYEQHQDASDEELALLELPRSCGNFNQQAAAYLLDRARHDAVPALETFLLEKSLPDPAEGRDWNSDFTRGWRQDVRVDLAARYAALRGESARDFTQAFSDMLRRDAATGKIPKDKHADQVATDLERILLQTSLPDQWRVLRETGQLPAAGVARTVWEARLETLPPADAYRMLLVEAADCPAAEARGVLAAQLRRLGERQAPTGLKPTDVAEAWGTLIADARPERAQVSVLVADRFLILNEQLFAPPPAEGDVAAPAGDLRLQETGRRAEEVMQIYGARGREWLRARVRQRLAGLPEAELPPYPENAAPDDSLLAALAGRFSAVSSRAEAAARMAGLPLPEYAAVTDLLRREPELNVRLIERTGQIENVTVEGEAGTWGDRLRAWEGRVPTLELVEDLRAFCLEQVKEQQYTADCRLSRKADFGGCELRVKIQPIDTKTPLPDGKKPRLVGVAGLACGPGNYGAAFWRTRPFGPKRHWWQQKPSGDYDVRRFQEAVAAIWSAATPANAEVFTVFQIQGEAE
jgi:hypothetical protein